MSLPADSVSMTALLLVRRTLRDDDYEVRANAARMVSDIVASPAPMCCEKSEKVWTAWLQAPFASDPRWLKYLLDELLDDTTISELRKQGSTLCVR